MKYDGLPVWDEEEVLIDTWWNVNSTAGMK